METKQHPRVEFAEWYFNDHVEEGDKITITRGQFFAFLSRYEMIPQ